MFVYFLLMSYLGAACAWMLNGVFQILDSGIIPGNRNCDNVDAQLEKFKYLLYPSKSVQTDGIKAAILKSFGFGQAGAEVLYEIYLNSSHVSSSKQNIGLSIQIIFLRL